MANEEADAAHVAAGKCLVIVPIGQRWQPRALARRETTETILSLFRGLGLLGQDGLGESAQDVILHARLKPRRALPVMPKSWFIAVRLAQFKELLPAVTAPFAELQEVEANGATVTRLVQQPCDGRRQDRAEFQVI